MPARDVATVGSVGHAVDGEALAPPHAPERAAAIERILGCELDCLVDRVVRKRLMPRGIAEEALREYKRFMVMSLLQAEVPMFSAEVDEIWHAHLLHTHDYQLFCHENFGYFVHHQPEPRTGAEDDDGETQDELDRQRAGFFVSYRALFGEPSSLWGKEPGRQ